MAVTQAELKARILLEDRMSGELGKVDAAMGRLGVSGNRIQGALGGVGDALGTVGKVAGVASLALGGAVAGGLVAAGKSAADFQSQISGIAAVGGKEAVDRMSEISAKALQVGKDTAFSATEAGAGMEALIRAGIGISDVLGGATDATVALAAATGVDLATSAEIAAGAMNQFHLKGAEVGDVADIIAGAANASAIDVNQFGLSLQSVGAVANLVGLSFKDTAVAIAEMGQAGIPASDAGTSLKTMLMSLQPATKKASEEFAKLGLIARNDAAVMKEATARGLDLGGSIDDVSQRLYASITGWKQGTKVTDEQGKKWSEAEKELGLLSNAFFTAEGKAKPLAEIQGVLADATKNLTQEQKLASLEIMFGSDAIRAAAVLADNGAEGFNKMAESMGKVSAADVAKTRLDNLNGSMEALKGSLEVASITIGTAMLPSLKMLVDGGIELLNANMPLIEQFANGLPGAMAAVGAFITGTLVPAFGTISTWTTGTGLPALSALTTALGPPLHAVVTWLSGTGLPGLLAAITGVSTVVQALTEFFGGNTVALALLTGGVTAGTVAWGLLTAGTLAHTIATRAQTIAAGLATAAQLALNVALTANPIGIVVIALAGLTAGLILAYNHNESFRKSVDRSWESLKIMWTWLENNRQKATDLAEVLSGFTGGDVLKGLQALGRILGGNFGGAGAQRTSLRTGGGAGAIHGDAMSLSGGGAGLQGDALLSHVYQQFKAAFGEEGGRAAAAVAKTEGGLYGAEGDYGSSFGVFQLHTPGQLENFANWLNTSLAEAAETATNRPDLAVQFALQNYLGKTIAAGLDAGLSGPALATYAQRHGQVSVSPERAGQSYEALFGAGGSAPETTVDMSGGRIDYILATDKATESTDRFSAAQIRSADAGRLFGGILTSAVGPTTALTAAQQFNAVWVKQMADEQTKLAQVMSGQVSPSTINTKAALADFGAVLGPIEREIAGGTMSLSRLQFKLVDLARATGVATEPWDQFASGAISSNEALKRVINASADAGPQFDALRQRINGAHPDMAIATLDFLQLALGIDKIAPAAAAVTGATTALSTATGTSADQTGAAVDQVGDLTGKFGELAPTISTATELVAAFQAAIDNLSTDRLSDQVSGWGGVTDAIGGATDQLGDFINQVREAQQVSGGDIPSFALGGRMNRDGLAYLHAGETVLTPAQSRQSPEPRLSFASVRAGGGGIHVENINISGVRTENPRTLAVAIRDELLKIGRPNAGRILG